MGWAPQVFISYTSELQNHPPQLSWAAAARRAVEHASYAPVDMELFGPYDDSPEQTCRSRLSDCEIWVGILAFRYGSRVPDGRSYTELEFDVAGELGLPRLVIVLEDDATVLRRDDDWDHADRQQAFRARVLNSALHARPVTAAKVSTPEQVMVEVFKGLKNLTPRAPIPTMPYPPPPIIPSTLRDRVPQRRDLRELLLARRDRVVALLGEPGVGKTALASQLLLDLRDDQEQVAFGVLGYLSGAGYLSLTGATLLTRLAEAIRSPQQRRRIQEQLRNQESSWYERVEDVLQALDVNVLLVVDQVEQLLDADGRFQDRALNRLVEELSARDDHGVSLLLVSSQQPHDQLLGTRRSARFVLGEPLPPDQALDRLRDLAATSPPELLLNGERAVELAGCHPRSLELLVAAFAVNPALTVDDLGSLAELAPRARLRSLLLDYVVEGLPYEMLVVTRALSVLGLPSPATAVAQLLHGVLPRQQVGAVLEELAAIRFLREVGGKYDLPAAEAGLVLDSWWAAPEGAAAREVFLQRGADHFANLTMRTHVRGVEDLAPHFREIALRLDLEQYGECLLLMQDLDHHYLHGWGHRYVLMPWRRRLIGWEPGTNAWRANLSAMAVGANELDECAEAMHHLRTIWDSLPEHFKNSPAPPVRSAPDETASLDEVALQELEDALTLVSQLGRTAWQDGLVQTAHGWYSRELAWAQSLGRDYQQARALLGLGVCLLDLGQLPDAAAQLDTAGSVIRADHSDDGRELYSDILLAQAVVAGCIGDYLSAHTLVDDALRVATAAGVGQTRVACLDVKAGILLDQGRGEEAVGLAEEAAALAAGSGVTDITRTAHATLAVACLDQGRLDDARSSAASAARFFRSKRALVGYAVLGMVRIRETARPGAEDSARDAFQRVIRLVSAFPEEERPYQVWEVLGLAETGQHLCRIEGAKERAISAYRRARRMTAAPGATRRAAVFLDALTADSIPDQMVEIRRAALGLDAGDQFPTR